MVIGMYYHLFPPPEEAAERQCSCALHDQLAPAL
jgi:hypothetical protein